MPMTLNELNTFRGMSWANPTMGACVTVGAVRTCFVFHFLGNAHAPRK